MKSAGAGERGTPRVGIEAWNLFTHVIGMILDRTESERDVRPVVGEPVID